MSAFRGKKQLLFLASFVLLVLWSGKLSAQTTATTNLVVELDDIQNISLSTPNDTLKYNTATAYNTGFSTTINDHVTVTSTGDFQVQVATAGGNFVGVGNASNLLPVSSVKISAAAGSSNGGGTPANFTYASAFALSTTPTTLFSNTTDEVFINAATFNITYAAQPLTLSGTTEPDKYKINLVYTISPQ